MISLEVRDKQQKAKLLRERKFKDNNTSFVRVRFLQKFMASSEVLTARINWNPPSAKIFKTIAILKIYAHTLFFTSLITVVLKLFNLTCLNKININMNLEYSNLKLVSCIFTFYEKKAFKNVENFSSIYSIFSRFSLFLSQFPDSKGKTKKEIFVSMS